MEESSNKMLGMIAGVILTILVITAAFFIYTRSKSNLDNSLAAMDNLSNSMAEAEITQYAGNKVSGVTVMNAIKYFDNAGTKINIKVTLTDTVDYVCTVNSDYEFTDVTNMSALIKNAETASDPNYINPTLSFTGTLVRNPDTNAIVGITYTKN